MNILVLVKAVPLVGDERLDEQWQTDRTSLEANGADEYCLEKALQLTEASGGQVSVLSVGPASASEALRKALAMGAERAYHVVDDGLAGSDIRATVAVLAAACRKIEFDLVFSGADSSDGQGGVVGAALAVHLDLPYLSNAADVELVDGGSVRVKRLNASGHDILEASLPALIMGTQLLGEPRYPSLRGIMAARKKETVTLSLADLGIEPAFVGAAAATTAVSAAEMPAGRGGATVIQAEPDEAVRQVMSLLSDRGLV
ncbi:MAG: electron transfer flavoprotein subunit beta [Chloroflexota bacterium]